MEVTTVQGAAEAFEKAFGRRPAAVAHAGGRVNLIGEHTDYHDGFVFPAAIDLRTFAAGAPRADGVVRVWSENEQAEVACPVAELALPAGKADWRSYVLGPIWALREEGWRLPGMDVFLYGAVPFGGGLSSSASVEVSLVGLAAALAGAEVAAPEAARIARKAENDFCHVPCGIMDQMASACGREGHALLLDCRSLAIDPVPFPKDWVIVVADSMVKHSVGGGEYATRQRQCASGLAKIRERFPGIKAARDLTISLLDASAAALDEVEHRRLRHAVTENERCLRARDALKAADANRMGTLLAGSHQSLARDYEVSCPELDALVEAAVGCPGAIGARLTGAGFGGNTVNIVRARQAADFRAALEMAYLRATGKRTVTRLVKPAGGLAVARL